MQQENYGKAKRLSKNGFMNKRERIEKYLSKEKRKNDGPLS